MSALKSRNTFVEVDTFYYHASKKIFYLGLEQILKLISFIVRM